MDTTNDFTVKAFSGQGASSVGVSGALTVSIIDSDVNAYLGDTAAVTITAADGI